MTIKDIRDGWFNFMKGCIRRRSLDPELRAAIEKRSEICSKCPKLKVMSRRGFILTGKCESCGCCFPMIVYAKGKKCPEGKWDAISDHVRD
ncbi:hypothetical protein CL634_07990 [bacterium]|nr:hypothetical protein [bacterium]